jgi:hypothetical protein
LDIYTSIPPARSRIAAPLDGETLDYASECLGSWKRNGFTVHTINRQAEIEEVREMTSLEPEAFPETHDCFFPGRYGPPFAAIFKSLDETRPCAIINADIYMLLTPDVTARLRQLSEKNFVFGRRTEVHGLTGGMDKIYEFGVDFISFTPSNISSIIQDYDVRRWQLGVCWWDYVLPIAASFYIPIKRVREPFIFHRHHEHKLYATEFAHMRAAAWQTLKRLSALQSEKNPSASEFKKRLEALEALTKDSMSAWEGGFAGLCCEWLFGPSGPAEEIELPIDPRDSVFRNLLHATLSRPSEKAPGVLQNAGEAVRSEGGATAEQPVRKRKLKSQIKLWMLKRRNRGPLAAVRRSNFFQPHWYLHHYPDVAVAGIDPALHYLTFGFKEKRDPGPHFSTERYLQDHPDVAVSGINPLVHYVMHGRIEGRNIKTTLPGTEMGFGDA